MSSYVLGRPYSSTAWMVQLHTQHRAGVAEFTIWAYDNAVQRGWQWDEAQDVIGSLALQDGDGNYTV